MSKVVVTGGKGQLASCIKDLAIDSAHTFVFVDVDELDITNREAIQNFFQKEDFSFCINCAAYTAVDKAETDTDLAERINRQL